MNSLSAAAACWLRKVNLSIIPYYTCVGVGVNEWVSGRECLQVCLCFFKTQSPVLRLHWPCTCIDIGTCTLVLRRSQPPNHAGAEPTDGPKTMTNRTATEHQKHNTDSAVHYSSCSNANCYQNYTSPILWIQWFMGTHCIHVHSAVCGRLSLTLY